MIYLCSIKLKTTDMNTKKLVELEAKKNELMNVWFDTLQKNDIDSYVVLNTHKTFKDAENEYKTLVKSEYNELESLIANNHNIFDHSLCLLHDFLLECASPMLESNERPNEFGEIVCIGSYPSYIKGCYKCYFSVVKNNVAYGFVVTTTNRIKSGVVF